MITIMLIYIIYFYALFKLYLTYYFMNHLLRELTADEYTFRLMCYSAILYACEIYLEYTTYSMAYYAFIFFYFLWCYLRYI